MSGVTVSREVATGREGVKNRLGVKKGALVSGPCDWEDRSLAELHAGQGFKTQCALRQICQGRVVANGSSNIRPRICRAPSSSLVGNPKSVQTVSPGSPPLWGSEEAALIVCLTFSPPLDLLSTKPRQLAGHFEPEPRGPGSVALKALFRKTLAHVCTQ